MTTRSSVLAWRILQPEEPGGPQSTGLQRVGHNWSDLARKHTHSLVAQMVKSLSSMQETWIIPGVRRNPWRREWLPTPIFLPGEFHGQRSLGGFSSWGCKESDMTEWLTLSHFFAFISQQIINGRSGIWTSVQFSSVAQLCPTLGDPMNQSTPGLPVHHQLLEFTHTRVHQVGDAIQPSHPLSSPSPPAPKPSQHQGLFQWVNSSHEVAKVL